MNLYLISADEHDKWEYFEKAVVCAPDEDTARFIHPRRGELMSRENWIDHMYEWSPSPEKVTVKFIGTAAEGIPQGVICSYYESGMM
jgi:hypothetical protein